MVTVTVLLATVAVTSAVTEVVAIARTVLAISASPSTLVFVHK